MRIVPKTSGEYAYIELDMENQLRIKALQEKLSHFRIESRRLTGLEIEVSEHDNIPEDTRRLLREGRFLVVE